MGKVPAELLLFSLEKALTLHLKSLLLHCTLIDNSYEPISAREFDSFICSVALVETSKLHKVLGDRIYFSGFTPELLLDLQKF